MASIEELTRQLNEYVVSNNAALVTSFRDVSEEMNSVEQRVAELEEALRDRRNGQGDGGVKGKSLIHVKMITPTVLALTEHWKKWKGDIGEYCEHSHPGIKDLMEQAKKAEDDIGESWFNDADDC